MKTVLITGAGGFIGGHAAAHLKRQGMRVIGVSRSAGSRENYDSVYQATLRDSLEDLFSGERIDAVVHCANHAGEDEFATNVLGATQWFVEARSHGVTLQILLSSLSAQANALSDYGRAKFALEEHFKSSNQVTFQLGLVVGNGGMFERMKASQRRLPLVPLLDNGSPRVYVLGIDYLCEILHRCIASDGEGMRGGIWRVQQPTAHTLREVMEGIRKHFGYRCNFIPVPSLPVLWLLNLAERLRLRLPVDSTNLRGLRQGRFVEFDSDFALFNRKEESLDSLIAKAAEHEKKARKDLATP